MNDDLFAIVHLIDSAAEHELGSCILVQSRAFSSENKEIMWEKVKCTFDFPVFSPYMCSIDL